MSGLERFDLTGKTALVTGGSRGIGRGIAIALAEHGADVGIVYRSAADEANSAAERIRELGRSAWVYAQDLAELEALHPLADRAWRDMGKIDILVNNAAMVYSEHFNQITIERWRRVLAVNVDAMFFLTQRVAEHMIDAGIEGRIINLSSANGFAAEVGLAHYNTSKGAVEMLTRSLACELGQHGITANSICPGVIETEIGAEFEMDQEEFFKAYRHHIPLQGRLGTIEDCAGIAVFLAARAGAYVTGQHVINDGGILCQQMPRFQFMPPYRNTLG